MRVLSVITRLTLGGSDRRLVDVLAALPDADHEVVVGGESLPDKVDALAADVRVHQIPSLRRAVSPDDDSRTLAEMVAYLRAGRFDVVHTHQSKAGLLGRIAARLARVHVVYHSASMASFGPGYGRAEDAVFRTAERVTARLLDRTFVVGHDLARRLAANGSPTDRLSVVRSSLDLDRFVPVDDDVRRNLRPTFGVPAGAAVVSYVGSLDDRKQVSQLSRITERTEVRLGRPVHVLVAGAGPSAGDVERTFAAAGRTDRLHLLGHTARVPEVMQASDALVLPSRAEGVPQVLVQAMAVGLPFAAYDVDGVAELAGLGARSAIVPLGRPEELGDRLAGMASSPPTPVARHRLDEWRPEHVRARYRALYAKDVAGQRAP